MRADQCKAIPFSSKTLYDSIHHLIIPQIGDKLPSVSVMEGTPNNTVNLAELFAGKKGVLFAVPGAFTPGCAKVCCLI